MTKNRWVLFLLFFSSCLREARKEDKQLDNAALDLQRLSMWHREYSFLVIKWRGKNTDSVGYYESKMDSVLTEYQRHMRAYDSLSELHKIKTGK